MSVPVATAGLAPIAPLVRRHWRSIVPSMTHAMHKGSCGRVAIVGGSVDYSGAPYFAAISAMTCGADLVYVLCPPEAALAIKPYSPDLCVRPLLSDEALEECLRVVGTCHAIVVGPGIGDGDAAIRERLLPAVVRHARAAGIPIVIDTAVMTFPAVLARLREPRDAATATAPVYLTPNGREILLLTGSVAGAAAEARLRGGDEATKRAVTRDVGTALGAVVAVKGFEDFVFDGFTASTTTGADDSGGEPFPVSAAVGMLHAGSSPSPRRAAGQGDVFAGTLGCFAAWAKIAATARHDQEQASEPPTDALPPLLAPCCASLVVREAARLAFAAKGRSMLASDVCAHVGQAMCDVEEVMTARGPNHFSD